MHQLCLGCWRSRSELKFHQYPSGNRRSLCYDCRNSGVCEPKTTYKKTQESLPLNERNRICSQCFEEKNLLNNYPEQGFLDSGQKKYGSKCSDCRNSGFRTPEYRQKAAVWREQGNLPEYMREYNKRYRQTEIGAAKHRAGHLKRKALIKNQENFMTSTFSEDLLIMCNNECQKCESTENLQYDHIIPVAWGRICDWSLLNAQILCADCNNNKSDSFSHDFRDMSVAIPGEEDSSDIDIFAML